MTAIEPATYREVMAHYPTGVTAVTGVADDGRPVAMVVGTFSAVSLDPPLVSFMPMISSATFARLRTAKSYCINVLAHDQVELCRTLAAPREDKLAGVGWSMSPHGAPMLDDVVAYVHCRPHRTIEAGDHYIELCEVVAMEVNRPVTPLLFFQGGYGGFTTRSMTAVTGGDLVAAVQLGEVARPYIERLARELGCEAGVLVHVGDDELMTVSAAYGGDVEVSERIGERIPLMPPVGEAYVAFNGEEAAERWLSRAATRDERVLARYRARLEAVRRQGWSMTRRNSAGGVGYAEFTAALQEYATGPLTPARERAVRATIAEAAHLYEVVELDDAETYDVGSLVVPVRNPEGGVSMLLRLLQLPQNASAERVRGWVAALQDAAAKTERALRDQHRDGLEEYLSWYRSEFPM